MSTRTEQKSIAAEMAAHVIQEMDELKMRPGNGTSMSPLRPTLGEMTGLIDHAIEKLSAGHKTPIVVTGTTGAFGSPPSDHIGTRPAYPYADGIFVKQLKDKVRHVNGATMAGVVTAVLSRSSGTTYGVMWDDMTERWHSAEEIIAESETKKEMGIPR